MKYVVAAFIAIGVLFSAAAQAAPVLPALMQTDQAATSVGSVEKVCWGGGCGGWGAAGAAVGTAADVAAAVPVTALAGIPATVPVDTMVGAAAIAGGLTVPGTVAAGAAAAGAAAPGAAAAGAAAAGSLPQDQPCISDVYHDDAQKKPRKLRGFSVFVLSCVFIGKPLRTFPDAL